MAKKTLKTYIYVFTILLPFVFLTLCSIFTKYNLFLKIPTLNDEIGYWRELYCFSKAGFNYGSSSFLISSQAQLGPFGTHGISPILVYGWFVLLFGWNDNSLIIANTLMLSVSILIFIVLNKPTVKKCFLIILCVASFTPLMIYLPSSMLEVPCYALLITFSAFFIKYVKKRKNRYFICMIIVTTALTITRACYAIVLFPAIIIFCENQFNEKFFKSMFLYIAIFCIIYGLYSKTVAPFPYNFNIGQPNENFIISTLNNFISNFKLYIDINNGSLLEITFRLSTLALILFSIYISLRSENDKDNYIYLYFGISLLLLVLSVMLLYNIYDWRDYRVIAPFTFICLFIILQNYSSASLHIKMLYAVLLINTALTINNISRNVNYYYDESLYAEYSKFFNDIESQIDDNGLCVSITGVCANNMFYISKALPTKIDIYYYISYQEILDTLPKTFFYEKLLENNNYSLIKGNDKLGYLYTRKY